jgi:hypothetical protein
LVKYGITLDDFVNKRKEENSFSLASLLLGMGAIYSFFFRSSASTNNTAPPPQQLFSWLVHVLYM